MAGTLLVGDREPTAAELALRDEINAIREKWRGCKRVKIPRPGPEFDALVERILHEVSAHGTQGWNMTDYHVRDVLNALAKEKQEEFL